MSIRQEVKRNLTKLGKRTKSPNQVDQINEKVILEGLKNDTKSVQILHPTMGYRKFCMDRIQFMGGTQAMWSIIATVLHDACVEQPQTQEKANG